MIDEETLLKSYLPSMTIAEKYHYKFWNAVSNGKLKAKEEIVAGGYLIRTKKADNLVIPLNEMIRRHGASFVYRAYLLTPFPFPSAYRFSNMKNSMGILAVVKDKVPKGPVRVTGIVRDIDSLYGTDINRHTLMKTSLRRGKFILVDKIESMKLEEYFQLEKPTLDNTGVEKIVYSSFDDDFNRPLLFKLTACSMLQGEMGGIAVGFGEAPAVKLYGIRSTEWKELQRAIPKQIGEGDRFATSLEFLGPKRDEKIKVGGRKNYFPTGYVIDNKPQKYLEFVGDVRKDPAKYQNTEFKKGRFERSDATKIDLEKGAGISIYVEDKKLVIPRLRVLEISDVPYLPLESDARVVDGDLMREYVWDIGYFSYHKYLEAPDIEVGNYGSGINKILWKIRKEYEDVYYYMIYGDYIVSNGSDMGLNSATHWGRRLARTLNALERLRVPAPADFLWENLLDEFFGRFVDMYIKEIKVSNAIAEKKEKISKRTKVLVDVLGALNMVYPDGWTEDSFVKACVIRGISRDEGEAINLFDKLIIFGHVVEIGDKYIARDFNFRDRGGLID